MFNSVVIFGGLYFLYSYATKKNQPHLMFGIILTGTGALMLLRDFGKLHFNMSGEMFLIVMGLIFLFLYFKKGILGFVFPGFILPCIGIYIFIMNNMNKDYMWPSFFILLGLAFYMIYFSAFIHSSTWPLIPGTVLILFGMAAFAFALGILSWDMLSVVGQYQSYIISGGVVLLGVGILIKGLKR